MTAQTGRVSFPTPQSQARAGGKLHTHHVVQTRLKWTADFPKTLAFPILETVIKFSHHTYLTVLELLTNR